MDEKVIKMKEYKLRIIDDLIKRKLKGIGALLIEGPKWCGKTTSAEQAVRSSTYMADPTSQQQNIILADTNPKLLLMGETPKLIDEWQIAPKLWDAIRFEIDQRGEVGQFILTGSSVPVDRSQIFHTGTGRFAWLMMRPMSLYESSDSSGEISIKSLFEKKEFKGALNNLELEEIAFLVCRGGWPNSILLEDEYALEQAYNYYDAVVHTDMSRVDGVTRNPERVKNLMRAYARNQGQQISNEKLKADMIANDSESLDADTVLSYVNALKKIFVVEEMKAWNPNLRSKAAIRTSDTRYFIDSSIATAALRIGPNDLINDLNTFGFLFECMCVRDLRVYAQSLNGEVYHYRDNNGLECDAVIHLRDGSYGLIEIKLGGDKLIEEGATSLKRLRSMVDMEKMKEPAFLMVLIGTGKYAFEREDGVLVVPVGCLKH